MGELSHLWQALFWPMLRLIFGMACGLLLANILECMRWSDKLAKLAFPLAARAHLGPVAASSFAMAFVSPASANAMLAEARARGEVGEKELILANLFNGLPASLVHMPTIFFLTWPVLGVSALVYSGLSLAASLGRAVVTLFLGIWLLPASHLNDNSAAARGEPLKQRFISGMGKAWRRFVKRLPKLVYFTAPFYVLCFAGQQYGFFAVAQDWLGRHLDWLDFIRPEAMGIVILQMAAEMGASLGAAAAVLETGALSPQDVVAALLAGNILAAPMRAIRHQFPAYAGFYTPWLACKLIVANQGLRAASMIVILLWYVHM